MVFIPGQGSKPRCLDKLSQGQKDVLKDKKAACNLRALENIKIKLNFP